MNLLERLFASRAARIAVLLVWLAFGGLGGSFAQRFQNIQKNEESSFLPGSSESVKELTLAKRFPSGERFTARTVVRRNGGLESGDLAAIEKVRASLAASPPVTGSNVVPVRALPDHTTALLGRQSQPRRRRDAAQIIGGTGRKPNGAATRTWTERQGLRTGRVLP